MRLATYRTEKNDIMSYVYVFVLFQILLLPTFCLENYTRSYNSNSGVASTRHDPDRVKNGKKAAVEALRAMSSEECDWKSNPISLLRGEPCGRYYKVLGLPRHGADMSTIKKRYREKSKILHPDKNPSEEAQRAFTSLTEGYSCLMDDSCRSEYDDVLRQIEQNNAIRRSQKIQHVSIRLQEIMAKAHYYITYYAAGIDRVATDTWAKLGAIRLFDVQVGRFAALLYAGLWRKSVFLVYLLSKAVLVLNDALIQSASR